MEKCFLQLVSLVIFPVRKATPTSEQKCKWKCKSLTTWSLCKSIKVLALATSHIYQMVKQYYFIEQALEKMKPLPEVENEVLLSSSIGLEMRHHQFPAVKTLSVIIFSPGISIAPLPLLHMAYDMHA